MILVFVNKNLQSIQNTCLYIVLTNIDCLMTGRNPLRLYEHHYLGWDTEDGYICYCLYIIMLITRISWTIWILTLGEEKVSCNGMTPPQ